MAMLLLSLWGKSSNDTCVGVESQLCWVQDRALYFIICRLKNAQKHSHARTHQHHCWKKKKRTPKTTSSSRLKLFNRLIRLRFLLSGHCLWKVNGQDMNLITIYSRFYTNSIIKVVIREVKNLQSRNPKRCLLSQPLGLCAKLTTDYWTSSLWPDWTQQVMHLYWFSLLKGRSFCGFIPRFRKWQEARQHLVNYTSWLMYHYLVTLGVEHELYHYLGSLGEEHELYHYLVTLGEEHELYHYLVTVGEGRNMTCALRASLGQHWPQTENGLLRLLLGGLVKDDLVKNI